MKGCGGNEIKTMGDAVMMRCAHAGHAVELGLAIVEKAGERSHFPIVRVGMNTGRAVEQHGDWFGAAVNVAARIAALAGGGEVLVSGATRAAAGEVEGVEFGEYGRQRFKNVRGEIEVYRAARAGKAAAGPAIDPVCHMAVHPGREVGSVRFGGREYRFCSLECVRAFSAAPEEYVKG
jgi:adenylate cyclase